MGDHRLRTKGATWVCMHSQSDVAAASRRGPEQGSGWRGRADGPAALAGVVERWWPRIAYRAE
eukprot:scaffold126209_cov42-Tisochrysis_lutea.AAC.3